MPGAKEIFPHTILGMRAIGLPALAQYNVVVTCTRVTLKECLLIMQCMIACNSIIITTTVHASCVVMIPTEGCSHGVPVQFSPHQIFCKYPSSIVYNVARKWNIFLTLDHGIDYLKQLRYSTFIQLGWVLNFSAWLTKNMRII